MSIGTIYCYPGNTRVKRIQAVAVLSNCSVDFEEVQHGWTRQPEVKAKWPVGMLPVFKSDDGAHLSDSLAICRYVCTRSQSELIPNDINEAAQVDMWCNYAEGELSAWLTSVAGMHAGYIHHEPENYKFFKDRFLHRLDIIESYLASPEGREDKDEESKNTSKQYLVGDKMSLADIVLATVFEEKLVKNLIVDRQVRDKFPLVFALHQRVTTHSKISSVFGQEEDFVETAPAIAEYQGPDFMSTAWWRT